MREETTTASSSDHRAQRCSGGKMVGGMWARDASEEYGRRMCVKNMDEEFG